MNFLNFSQRLVGSVYIQLFVSLFYLVYGFRFEKCFKCKMEYCFTQAKLKIAPPLPLLDLGQFMFGCTGLDSVLFVRYKTYGTVIADKTCVYS